MSTKIYNGYKISNTNWSDLYQKSLKLKKILKKEAQNVFDFNCFLEVFLALDKGEKEPLSVAFKRVQQHWDNNRKGLRDPFWDTDCSWVFIEKRDYFLALLYSEQDQFSGIWMKELGAEEYYYFDNTDQPEAISHKEWKQREIDWDCLGYDPPSTCGFSFEVSGKYQTPLLLDKKRAKELWGKYENDEFILKARARRIAEDEVFKDFDGDKTDTTSISKFLRENRKKIKEQTEKELKALKKWAPENL